MRALLVAAALALAGPALAVESTQWPPPEGVEARMRELQQAIMARDSTLAQREAAREELMGLLKSPAGQDRPLPGEKRPARAAIEPYPSVVAPMTVLPAPPPPTGVATVEVIVAPKPVVIQRSGAVASPTGRFAIDPRTGNVLHESGGGYVDPRTGQFVPR